MLKVERPGSGGGARRWTPPELAGKSLWFAAVNRNKRSLPPRLGEDGLCVLRRQGTV